jgi:molybdopterin/thiamine biosynthesis adenylyltransferase
MASAPTTRRTILEFEDERDRYHRQSLISWWDQDRLQEATMLVVGAGALGNELVKNLALAGVGRIVVVDFDRIENSNLARCVFFRESDDGLAKAEVLTRRAMELNRDIRAIPVTGDIRLTCGLAVFAEVDVVLAGLDNREARLFVNQACWKTGTPWVDGAIEGLMGVVRLFVPPDSACYECTMSERDRELLAQRRACSLLTRDEMLVGRVPTTGTSASVVAGIQAQEAIKALHSDRLGVSALAGSGFHFVGLTHDSYVVRYARRDECLSHDTYDLGTAEHVSPDVTFSELLKRARRRLGSTAVLELEHEIVLDATCSDCGRTDAVQRPVIALAVGAALCPVCRRERRLSFAYVIDGRSPLLTHTPRSLGLPAADVVMARVGPNRAAFVTSGGRDPVELLEEAIDDAA